MEYIIGVALLAFMAYLVWRKKKAKEKAKAEALATPPVPEPMTPEEAFKKYIDAGGK